MSSFMRSSPEFGCEFVHAFLINIVGLTPLVQAQLGEYAARQRQAETQLKDLKEAESRAEGLKMQLRSLIQEEARLTEKVGVLKDSVRQKSAEVIGLELSARITKANARKSAKTKEEQNECVECDREMELPLFATQCSKCTGWICNECGELESQGEVVAKKFFCPGVCSSAARAPKKAKVVVAAADAVDVGKVKRKQKAAKSSAKNN